MSRQKLGGRMNYRDLGAADATSSSYWPPFTYAAPIKPTVLDSRNATTHNGGRPDPGYLEAARRAVESPNPRTAEMAMVVLAVGSVQGAAIKLGCSDQLIYRRLRSWLASA